MHIYQLGAMEIDTKVDGDLSMVGYEYEYEYDYEYEYEYDDEIEIDEIDGQIMM